jgi:hypothetical protein
VCGKDQGSRIPASHSRPVSNIMCKIADNCVCDEEAFIMTSYSGHLYSEGDSLSSPATLESKATKLPK